MSSTAQIEANRANAQHSTGPRTEEGKAASRYNAMKTGLTSAFIWVDENREEDFNRLRAGLLNDLKPEGQLEKNLFDTILHASWCIFQCQWHESAFLGKGALTDHGLFKYLDRINRYRRNHETTMRRALAELRKLQTERIWRRESRRFQEDSVLAQTKPARTPVGKAIGIARQQPQPAPPARAA